METRKTKLSAVKLNKANPRNITADKINKLVNSILVFPKMLSIRPVVVDEYGFPSLHGEVVKYWKPIIPPNATPRA